MGYRNFTDAQGRKWEVRERAKSEWELHPVGDNQERMRTVRPPSYERDPFEMSIEELQRLLEQPDQLGRTKPPQVAFCRLAPDLLHIWKGMPLLCPLRGVPQTGIIGTN